ncbi:hypothetical protein PCL_12671 [Purpureocillium lilacinum]|uniref:Uncharacterized protein n=1 Tax=Purpureocillium lilacinum TaxID=33203 RepID=A0A2U3DPB8_PURLI|nr:hypothetical protein PCL_12671 [Purpureocillium lilacinum]
MMAHKGCLQLKASGRQDDDHQKADSGFPSFCAYCEKQIMNADSCRLFCSDEYVHAARWKVGTDPAKMQASRFQNE